MNERKAREDLKSQSDASLEVERGRLEEERTASERRTRAEEALESWRTRQRRLGEDLRFVRAEVRDRRDQREKLEAKYAVLVRALGNKDGSGGDKGSDDEDEEKVVMVTNFVGGVVNFCCFVFILGAPLGFDFFCAKFGNLSEIVT